MRILYLTTGCFDKGGISRYNRYQITALRQLVGNDNVRVLSLARPMPGDFEEPFAVNWCGNGTTVTSKARFVMRVLKEALAWKPNIVLTGHVNFSALALVAARIGKSISILNTYGLEVWSGMSLDAAWGLKRTAYVISDCYYTARYLESQNLRKEGSVEVIWDCVDLDRFNPQITVPNDLLSKYCLPDPLEFKLIVSLGRISKTAAHKGYDRLIRAFSAIHSKNPKARLVLAGKGDLTEHLMSLAREYHVNDKVTFTGMIAEQDLPAIYKIAHVFSLVSDRGKGRGEGIPLTPLEAMACRVPIIVGNQDGSQEAVIDEGNGFVIDPFDIDNHSQKLHMLLSDLRLREEKADKALAVAREHFSYGKFKAKHQQLLDRLRRVNS